MTTDRELLELAAKAAGIGGGWNWPRGAKHPMFWRDGSGKAWQPLDDDGDALRLAVKLQIDVLYDGMLALAEWEKPDSIDRQQVYEVLQRDPYAATRRAIVRAAAEIGRNMK